MIMTPKDKELLLKDLCARLPYGVKVQSTFYNCDCTIWKYENEILTAGLLGYPITRYKPYLFPMSSMTDEQCFDFYCKFVENDIDYNDFKKYYFDSCSWDKVLTTISDCGDVIDWFNKYHFDYRGLIEKGLAIDATELNIY